MSRRSGVSIGYTCVRRENSVSVELDSGFCNVSCRRTTLLRQEGGRPVKIGYIRVSTLEQNTIRQEVMMKELGGGGAVP